MAKTAILSVDLLGVQKMWKTGGAAAVRQRIDEFGQFVIDQLTYLPTEIHRDGDYTAVISADSASIMCEDYDQAIGMAIHLFVQAFYARDKSSAPFWLRGAISKWSNQYMVANTVPFRAKEIQVGTFYQMEDDYLCAVALEKSGFRGMRILINANDLPQRGRGHTRQWTGFDSNLGIVARLKEFMYPEGGYYADVLWMADREDHYENLCNIMASRFKRSTHDQDEFRQAAWTRATFDQVATLIWACRNPKKKHP